MFDNDSEKGRKGKGLSFNMLIVIQYHFSLSPFAPMMVLVSFLSNLKFFFLSKWFQVSLKLHKSLHQYLFFIS